MRRGRLDTNSAFADGSVTRFDGVIRARDERMADVPEYFSGDQYDTTDTSRRVQVPPK